jgi:hypothetical protein
MVAKFEGLPVKFRCIISLISVVHWKQLHHLFNWPLAHIMRDQEAAASRTMLEYMTLFHEYKYLAEHIHPSYQKLYTNVATMMSVPPGMANASIDDLYSSTRCGRRQMQWLLFQGTWRRVTLG